MRPPGVAHIHPAANRDLRYGQTRERYRAVEQLTPQRAVEPPNLLDCGWQPSLGKLAGDPVIRQIPSKNALAALVPLEY
jgi:hypothetical protein